jgi:hypothetical protein
MNPGAIRKLYSWVKRGMMTFENNYDYFNDKIITITHNIERMPSEGGSWKSKMGRSDNLEFYHELPIPMHAKC